DNTPPSLDELLASGLPKDLFARGHAIAEWTVAVRVARQFRKHFRDEGVEVKRRPAVATLIEQEGESELSNAPVDLIVEVPGQGCVYLVSIGISEHIEE